MGQNPHVRIIDNLDDDSYWMLQIYLMIQKVVLVYYFQSASGDSPSGEVEDWSNHLGSSLLDQALKIEQSVCYQMTPRFPGLGQGRCKCGATKSLKFKWKEEPIPHASFSGGVSNILSDRSLHDSAKSCSDSIWEALGKYRMIIGIKDLEALLDKCCRLHSDWIQREEVTGTDLDLCPKVYGGPHKMLPFTSAKQICAMLEKVLKIVNECIPIDSEEEK